jgi:molybdopterin molybdotransferase
MGASEVLPQAFAVPVAAAMENAGDRPHYIRGQVKGGVFLAKGLQQSHALFALSQANALLRLEAGQRLQAGEAGSVMFV